MMFANFIIGLCLFVISVVFYQWSRNKSATKLPPGPKPLPIIGNALDLAPPGTPEHLHWMKHREQYGPISSVSVLGQTIIILHDKQAAIDLCEKRSSKNSSRSWLEFAFGLCGFEPMTAALPYDERFRLQRKLLHQYMGTKTLVKDFSQDLEAEVLRTLHRILERPEGLFDHLKTQAAALIIELTYGYRIDTTGSDPVLGLVTRMMEIFSLGARPGHWAVDMLPILKYVPAWFPGAGFQKTALKWKAEIHAAVEAPYEFARRRQKDRIYENSYIAKFLARAGDAPEASMETALKNSAAALYSGGSDTTIITLKYLYLAMIMFPEVLRKAQEEIDSVTGSGDRLPQLDDRERLPYVEAVVMEALRWHPVAPMGLVHLSDEDQVYNGYSIPKGAILMAAIHWYANDPGVFHDPDLFLPERFSDPYNEPDPRDFVFGFGRRICPGRHFANSSLFLTIAQTLACFDIKKAVDKEGQEVEPRLEVIPGALAHLADFEFQIMPRGEKHVRLIESCPVSGVFSKGDVDAFLEGVVKE